MVNWNTTERGQNRERDNGRTDGLGPNQDYDGLSCMHGPWWPYTTNGGYGVEDTTILHGLGLRSMSEPDDADGSDSDVDNLGLNAMEGDSDTDRI